MVIKKHKPSLEGVLIRRRVSVAEYFENMGIRTHEQLVTVLESLIGAYRVSEKLQEEAFAWVATLKKPEEKKPAKKPEEKPQKPAKKSEPKPQEEQEEKPKKASGRSKKRSTTKKKSTTKSRTRKRTKKSSSKTNSKAKEEKE